MGKLLESELIKEPSFGDRIEELKKFWIDNANRTINELLGEYRRRAERILAEINLQKVFDVQKTGMMMETTAELEAGLSLLSKGKIQSKFKN